MDIVSINLTPDDVKYLDHQLLNPETGRIKLLPASVYKNIDPVHLVLWGTLRARFTFPTVELVDWLRTMIGSRVAIEIGSGNGDLAYHLGIPATDNYCQQRPEVQLYYASLRQVPTKPSSDVKKLDAITAINRYKPKVVVGSYITQKHKEGEKNGSVYGPEEEGILDRADCYIHIGNEVSHGDKRLLKYTHDTLRFDWLITKSMHPEQNVIYVWGK